MEDFESHFLGNYYDIVKENLLESSLKFTTLSQKLDELKNKLQTEEKSSSLNENQLEHESSNRGELVETNTNEISVLDCSNDKEKDEGEREIEEEHSTDEE
ncbi:hypothetical protein BpHYR1_046728 [Brachionus plicatilis]|uniref:Uncharacterized protein n=1 Tax=Brachionus plicatilis TaxID=10195 RepID=A0A3M7SE52_BRAPC|nr:hypothetical protein BpHYR1_046728 [Brachionus plicatilis]